MTIVDWNGAHVKALRKALRDSQVQFAERIGYSVAVVGKWEGNGDRQTLMPRFAEAMDTVLHGLDERQRERFEAALADVGTTGTGPVPVVPSGLITTEAAPGRVPDVTEEVGEDAVNRRESLTAMAGLSMLATGMAQPGKALARIGVSDAARVQAETDRLERADQHIGGGSLLVEGRRKLEQAKTLIETGEFTSESGPAFMSATGNLAVLVGWLAYDSENHPLARRCYSDALSLANLAGDDELTVHACLHAALQSNRLARQGAGSAHYTLRLTERARTLTHGLPSGRIHALVATREASAFAILGDSAAFSRQIATASREMDRAVEHEPLQDCSVWLRFMSHAEIRFQEARGCDDLGRTGNAITVYADAIEREAGTRNAVNYQAHLATALAGVGDTRSSVVEGTVVLDHLEGAVSSTRTLRDMAAVRAAVRDGGHATAGDFATRYDLLARKTG